MDRANALRSSRLLLLSRSVYHVLLETNHRDAPLFFYTMLQECGLI